MDWFWNPDPGSTLGLQLFFYQFIYLTKRRGTVRTRACLLNNQRNLVNLVIKVFDVDETLDRFYVLTDDVVETFIRFLVFQFCTSTTYDRSGSRAKTTKQNQGSSLRPPLCFFKWTWIKKTRHSQDSSHRLNHTAESKDETIKVSCVIHMLNANEMVTRSSTSFANNVDRRWLQTSTLAVQSKDFKTIHETFKRNMNTLLSKWMMVWWSLWFVYC